MMTRPEITMVDLRGQYQSIKAEIDRAIQSVLDSTAFIQGKEVTEFAEALAKYCGAMHCIPCANGTDALQIAMMALDLQPGDEVIVPVHTYVATAEVIALLKLSPVFVDVDQHTFNLDAEALKKAVSNKTKLIVPVHLYGQCANMEEILRFANSKNIPVIEDAAQALGAEVTFANGEVKKAGTMGVIGTTSFFPSKNLGCYGDGGALFTNDSELAQKIKMIANHGQRIKYHHDIIGVNSRLDTVQAAILNVKLQYLDKYTQARQRAAAFYDNSLDGLHFIKTPARAAFSTHVFHQYTVRIQGRDRNEFKRFLEKSGIPSMIYYPVPLHLQKAYQSPAYPSGSFPVTERLSESVISLPIHTEMSEDQLGYIVETIKQF